MKNIIFFLLIAFIYCKTKEESMKDFVRCAKKQIGKKYSEEIGSRGPYKFNNPGLIWYCRSQAGFPLIKTIYSISKNYDSHLKYAPYIFKKIFNYHPSLG